MQIHGPASVKGRVQVPGDKSVSHRSLILSAMASGTNTVQGLLESRDVLSTRDCLARLGALIEKQGPGHYRVTGWGKSGPQEPSSVLDCGNSGTTTRLLMGLVSAHPGVYVFQGDSSLSQRPMDRVAIPLAQAGAMFMGRGGNTRLPMALQGARLRSLDYTLPVASAQLKSSLLLAACGTGGTWRIVEPIATRDHTERMFAGSGVTLTREGTTLVFTGPQTPAPGPIRVVGDVSSAAFFIVAGLLARSGEVVLEGVNLNPTRSGVIDVVRAMGGNIEVEPGPDVCGEPQGTIRVRPGPLKATRIDGALIPRLIDELPVLAALACVAEGVTSIRDARELRAKECDRLRALATELPKLGAQVHEVEDGMDITGVGRLRGAVVESWDDHRIAMTMAVAGLAAEGITTVQGAHCVDVSYPSFFEDLGRLAPEAIRK